MIYSFDLMDCRDAVTKVLSNGMAFALSFLGAIDPGAPLQAYS